jgi:hypothetical protein
MADTACTFTLPTLFGTQAPAHNSAEKKTPDPLPMTVRALQVAVYLFNLFPRAHIFPSSYLKLHPIITFSVCHFFKKVRGYARNQENKSQTFRNFYIYILFYYFFDQL